MSINYVKYVSIWTPTFFCNTFSYSCDQKERSEIQFWLFEHVMIVILVSFSSIPSLEQRFQTLLLLKVLKISRREKAPLQVQHLEFIIIITIDQSIRGTYIQI